MPRTIPNGGTKNGQEMVPAWFHVYGDGSKGSISPCPHETQGQVFLTICMERKAL